MTLSELLGLGFTVRLANGNLMIRPKERLTPELIDRIKAGKARLVLELRIRLMAEWWCYSEAEVEHALAMASAHPDPWRTLLADDERWRATHPDRRPTKPAGHA